jgi:hypothetical protein
MEESEVVELSSEDEKKPKMVAKNGKKKLKTLRKDQKQPTLKNYFDVTNKNYFSTFSQAQLPAQVRLSFNIMKCY